MNFLREKNKNYEDGLEGYHDWKEGQLEPSDTVTEKDIQAWTGMFKTFWEQKELQAIWD